MQAFLRDDLLVFCREAPPEFNDHQRDVFCVFSGVGVSRLRIYLNTHGGDREERGDYDGDGGEGTMYNEAEDGDGGVGNVTAGTNGMQIDEMGENEEEELGGDSEMLGHEY